MFEKILIISSFVVFILFWVDAFKPILNRFIFFVMGIAMLSGVLFVGPEAKIIDYNLWLFAWSLSSIWFLFVWFLFVFLFSREK